MKVVQVQFKKVGKKYYFSPGEFELKNGDFCVVETIRGIELGRVCGGAMEISEDQLITELKSVIRIATKKDLQDNENNKLLEVESLEKIKKIVGKSNLEIKLLNCEYTLDRLKLIIYFEADTRVDFRVLVKDLAEEFRVRIELRQVGARDGAKMIGGLGPCGLVVCCNTFLGEFDNVSIKMAKNQNISLNPQKISGTCGKLLCCIKYENDVYQELRENMPDVGDIIKTDDGEGKVLSIDVLNRMLKVRFFDDKILYIKLSDIKSIRHKKSQETNTKELEVLE